MHFTKLQRHIINVNFKSISFPELEQGKDMYLKCLKNYANNSDINTGLNSRVSTFITIVRIHSYFNNAWCLIKKLFIEKHDNHCLSKTELKIFKPTVINDQSNQDYSLTVVVTCQTVCEFPSERCKMCSILNSVTLQLHLTEKSIVCKKYLLLFIPRKFSVLLLCVIVLIQGKYLQRLKTFIFC